MNESFEFSRISNEVIIIFIAICIGIIIGAEREYRGKSAGLRTFILVSFGSCIFTILSINIGVKDPDRIAANIITGIGFLGAGLIFRDDNKINGITTATTIWATASLGMAAGSGHIYLAITGTIIVMITLSALIPFQKYIESFHKTREYKIVTANKEDDLYIQQLFIKLQLNYELIRLEVHQTSFASTWVISGNIKAHHELLSILLNESKVISYQF